jgi:hypothetical protein
VSAVSLSSTLLEQVSARFELIASPPEHILFAGASQGFIGATLSGVTPGLRYAGGWSYQATGATKVQPRFLRRGPKGHTFVVGTTDGYLLNPGPAGAQDVFAWASSSANLEAPWSMQFGTAEPDWVHGAAATPDGGLAAVGSLGSPDSATAKRVLWLWNEQGTLTSQPLMFPNAKAVASGLDVDAEGNLYVLSAAPGSSLLKLSKKGDALSTTATGEAGECTDCSALATTPSGASFLFGTAPTSGGRVENRISRRGASGKLEWSVGLLNDLAPASLITSGEHLIVVGNLVDPNSFGTALLFELDQSGKPIRQLVFGTNLSVLSASRADSGRIDALARSGLLSSNTTLLVQIAP